MLKRATLGIWGKSCADPDYFGLVGGISSAGEGSFFRYFYYMNLIRLSIFVFGFERESLYHFANKIIK